MAGIHADFMVPDRNWLARRCRADFYAVEIGWLDDVAPISTRLRLAGLSSWSRRAHLLHAIFVYARTSLARDLPSTRGLM